MDSFAEGIDESYMEAKQSAMQLVNLGIFPMVLKAAIELDVLEIIAKAGPGAYLSPSEIAAQLPTQNPDAAVVLNRMLRLLAAHSVLKYSTRHLPNGQMELLYGLTPLCKLLTKNEDGISFAPLITIALNKAYVDSWYYFKDAVLEGAIPFNKAFGTSMFEYHEKDSKLSRLFNEAMTCTSTLFMSEVLKRYRGFEGLHSLVDVGGGTGAVIHMITSKYSSISGINFDLPYVIADAPHHPGVEHVGGDMFVSVPKAEAIFMRFILHDWGDEYCAKLLKNCYDALPSGGKLIVAEQIVPETPEPGALTHTTFGCDLAMMAVTQRGKERTEKEFEALAKEAGFQEFKVIFCSHEFVYIMEFLKKA